MRRRVPGWQRPWVQAALLGAFTLALGLVYQFSPAVVPTEEGLAVEATAEGLIGNDAYYHVRMAYLYRTGEVQEAGEHFHWTQESLWAHAFANKDYLFHRYLAPFTLLADDADDTAGLIIAGRIGAAVLLSLLVVVLYSVMRGLGVRGAWLFAAGLFAVGGGTLALRYGMCRSFLMSVPFALLGWWAILLRRYAWLAVVACGYTLAYTASHLLLALVLVRGVVDAVMGGDGRQGEGRKAALWRDAGLLAAAAGGIAIGAVLHPGTANLLQLWWVQNVVVLALAQEGGWPFLQAINEALGLGPAVQPTHPLRLGNELDAPGISSALQGSTALLIGPLVMAALAAVLRAVPSRQALLSLVVACLLVAAYLLSFRFIEYAAPFMVLVLALWFRDLAQHPRFRAWLQGDLARRVSLVRLIAGLAVAASVSNVLSGVYRDASAGRMEALEAGEWLRRHAGEERQLVWHDRWDYFPMLFFEAPNHDYLVGLDPTFSYVADPERHNLRRRIVDGEEADFIGALREDFAADYVLATLEDAKDFRERLAAYAEAGALREAARGGAGEEGEGGEDSYEGWVIYEVIDER